MKIRTTAMGVVLAALSLAIFTAPTVQAQTHAVPSRVTAEVDDTRTVQLKGNIHPMARPEFDRGAVSDSQPMTRMLLTLQRSAEQETALQQLMDAQQSKGSASYHAWLTPEQFGKQFGPSDTDVQAVTDWLTRQGFQVAKVAAGRTTIEFSGNAAQVRNAFHTEIHKFAMNGEEHMANVSEPAIPAALAPVVKGVVALHNFPMRSHLHNRGIYRLNRESKQLTPLFTFGNPANFALAPADFAKIYNLPNYNTTAGVNDGTGVTIAIVGQSNINAQDVHDFRNLFGLPQNFTQANNVILNGPDPGLQLGTGDEGESILDVEWAGAAAPGATILLVSTASTQTNPTQITAGIDLSAAYIVDNNIASILSESYGLCEPALGATQNQFFNVLWQQAAAQGISVVVSAGDNGPAGCDPDPNGPGNVAIDGLAVSGVASTPYNTAVGGTDFDPSAELNAPNTFWNTTNSTTTATLNASAQGYIPETTWDDSTCAFVFPQACTSPDPNFNGADISAGSGGPSNCAIFSGSNCSKGYAIPAYQVGFNTQFSTVRTIPDVSFFASNGGPLPPTPFSGVADIVCESDINTNGASCSLDSITDFTLVGGTSAATPPFAGILALLSQSLGGQRLGNVNFGLYALAKNDTSGYTAGKCQSSLNQTPAAGCTFNDVTKGNIAVACALGSTSVVNGQGTGWCSGTGNFGVTVITGTNTVAFAASSGYDLATGLGSINVSNLLANWKFFTRTATTTTLSNQVLVAPTASNFGNFTATVTVSPATATGNVAMNALAADQKTILGSVGGATNSSNGTTTPFTLSSSGTATIQTNLLPPGTAFVQATYSGDATNAASKSAPVALAAGPVAGANFQSRTAMNFVTFNTSTNPPTPVPTNQPQTVAYGSPYILAAIVSKSDGTNCAFNYPATNTPIPCPKGTIALTDSVNGGSPVNLNDFPSGPASNATNIAKLSNEGGLVEDANVQLPGGAHSIQAAFTSSDSNYQSSSSNKLSVTITPAQTQAVVTGGGTRASVTLTALIGSGSNSSQGPTGNVQFFNGNTSLGTANCVATGASFDSNGNLIGASCTATLATSVAALYPPGTRGPRPTLPLWPAVLAALSILLFALGRRWVPETRRRAYAYAGLLAFAMLAAGLATGCGGGGGGNSNALRVKATYAGDTNYAASTSSTTTILLQ